MPDFKLCINNPKTGKSYTKELKDPQASSLVHKNLGEKVTGESIGFAGYEFEVTGGSDKAGFPMRKGILGTLRKKIFTPKGPGFQGRNRWKQKSADLRRKKSVRGSKISPDITLVNLKILKEGSESLEAPKEEAAPSEEKKE